MLKKLFLLGVFAVANASAAIITYTDQVSFLAALGSYYQEDFELLGSLTNPTPFSGSGFSYDISSSGTLTPYIIDGDTALSVNEPFDNILINNFGGAPTAIGGFFYFDNNDGGFADAGLGIITVSNGVDTDVSVNVSGPYSPTSNFFGFISTAGPITSLTYERAAGDFPGYVDVDDLIVGTTDASQVPEPGSFALMGTGLLFAGWLGRRARR